MQAENSQIIHNDEMLMYHVGMKKNSIPRHGVGARITELRAQAGLSQKELAERIDVPIANIGFWERTNTPPSSKVLPQLAKALSVSVDELLGVKKTRMKRPVAKGQLQQVFEKASQLPRRQQHKIAEFVEAFVEKKAAR